MGHFPLGGGDPIITLPGDALLAINGLSDIFNSGDNGIYYDFSKTGSMYGDVQQLITENWKKVYSVADTKGVGAPYNANSESEARQWCSWGYILSAFAGTQLKVDLPDLENCSIIIITPSGVSIQEGQSVSGSYTLPDCAMRAYCVIDRPLTEQERTDVKAAYGSRYAIDYDATISARVQENTYHTADLGWVSNTDVGASGHVQALIDMLVNGDEVIFDAMYKISGNYHMESLSGIAFRAANKQTCGFDCLDAFEQIAGDLPVNKHAVFAVGDNFLVDGLYCTQGQVDTTLHDFDGGGGKRGWFASYGNTRFYAINCKFDTKGWMFLELGNGLTELVIARNILKDGQYCIYLYGQVDNAIVAHNYFTGGYTAPRLDGSWGNVFYDGIKTGGDLNNRGAENMVFVENAAEDILRDVIDTTGGLKDAIIDANVIRGTDAFDIKSIYNDSQSILDGNKIQNFGISMQYNLFEFFPARVFAVSTVWNVPETPDLEFSAGPVSSYRNVCRIDNVGPVFALNRNARGALSKQDLYLGPWVADHFVKIIDEYVPSLVYASERMDGIFIA